MREEAGEEAAEQGGEEEEEAEGEEEVEERLLTDRSTGSIWVWAGLLGAWVWAKACKCPGW